MPGTSFKNYVVNYELIVNSSASQGFAQVAQMAQRLQKPLKDISNHFKRLQQSASALTKSGAFEIRPTIDIKTFDAQSKTLITKAERVAAQINAILNGAFAVNPASPNAKGGNKKGTKSGASTGKTETRTFTTKQLQKEAENVKKQLRNLYGPRGPMRESSKGYKALVESLQNDIAKLNAFKQLRAQLAAVNSDIKAAVKNKGQITKTIKDGVGKSIVAGTKSGGKKGAQQSPVTKAFDGVLKSLATGKSVEVPVSVVVNSQTVASINAALAKIRAEIKPITIPVTLSSTITPSSTGVKAGKNGVPEGVAPVLTGKKGTRAGKAGKASVKASPVSEAVSPIYTQLQSLANGRPININTRVVSNGQSGFDLNQHLFRLQELATSRPIKIDTRLVSTGQAGFGLNAHLAKLQELASSRPIKLNTTVAQTTSGAKGAKGTATNAIPLEGMVENVVLSKGVKVSGGPVKVEGIVENVKAGKGMKPIEVKANVVAPGLNNQVNALRELSSIWKTLPKTGSRTYTVNLKMPGIENLGRLRELAAMVGTLPQSQRRSYSAGVGGKNANGGSSSGGRGTSLYYGGGRSTASRYIGRPRGTMNTFAYQLMGNTSLGARTPVFLDMMKGMGMMSGVGAAMSTLTNAFTNASEYQNTMVTAKSILEANYKGMNFDSDFNAMTHIVRDVAKKTKFTAPQAADAARFMAMAGLNIPMINASIRPIADVAVIGDNDLGEVADKITNIQTAFGIKPNEMRALADALTKTFTSSNTDMMMLAESMEYAAPMAHLAGAKVEDALAMIGIMGNAGIQGSMAGTTLRMMYQNVINPNKKQREMWEKLGISLKDSSGNPRQLIDILGDLRQKVRISREDKDEEGKFKDSGTPIAEAVSRLFRVTASAGAGTLLENLNKVKELAEANRNATGLSQQISEVKQNNVKGMWAKMTSAFTDAVVSEFESGDNSIKSYLQSLIEYFGSPDFRDMLHDIFDLVQSMMKMLGDFAKIWKSIYDTCGGLIKYVLMAQFWMTQVGYLFAPLRSIWMTASRGVGAAGALMSGGVMAGGAMAGAAGGGASAAAMAAGTAPFISFGNRGANYNTSAINAARATAARYDTALANSQKYLNAAKASHAATSPAIQRAIERKQMQWFVASNLVSSGAALHASDYRAARWNLAYTNPQAASELPNRFKIMSAREKEVAALQKQLADRQRNIAAGEAVVLANASSSKAAHQNLNKQIGMVRHANRRVNSAVLNRAVQMGKIGTFKAGGMSLSSGFRTAATWGVTGMSLASMSKGFVSVVGVVGKALGFLVNPITLAIAAFGGIIYAMNRYVKQINQDRAAYQQKVKAANERIKPTVDSISGKRSKDVVDLRKSLGLTTFELGDVSHVYDIGTILSKTPEHQKGWTFKKNPLIGNTLGAAHLFASSAGLAYSSYQEQALKEISNWSDYIHGKHISESGLKDIYTYKDMSYINGYGRIMEGTYKEKLENDAAIAGIMNLGATSAFAKKAAEPILERLQKWMSITDLDESNKEWQAIQELSKQVAEKYNPENKGYVRLRGNYTADRIKGMRYSEATRSYEYQLGIYKNLSQINDVDNPIFGSYYAINELRQNTDIGIEKWLELVGRVADSVTYQLPDMNGQMQTIAQKFENGKLSWAEFEKNINVYGLDVENRIAAFHNITVGAFMKFREIAIKAGRVPPTIDEFLKLNGSNLTQTDIKYQSDKQRDHVKGLFKTRYDNDPAFRAEINKKYGSYDEFMEKSYGTSGALFWKKQNYPDADLVNKTVDWATKQHIMSLGVPDEPSTPKTPVRTGGPTAFNWNSSNVWSNLKPNQQSYSSPYGNLAQTTIKPITINIDKIEATTTMKEEVDTKKLASLISEGFTNQMMSIIS